MTFSDALSRAIFRHPRSRQFPEICAVAFWLRRAAVARLAERFALLQAAGPLRAPRGLAFHLPPTNVDTLFVYSLMTSFLVGNANLVRVSRDRITEEVDLLCEVMRGVMVDERFRELRAELAVIAYGHEAEATRVASWAADVRLLWGGDDTISRIRGLGIGASTHDLSFGDRFSFAVIRSRALLEEGQPRQRLLGEQLFNDAYWFDQMGCASPRLIVWVGDEAETDVARRILFQQLAAAIARRGYTAQTATVLAKLTFEYGALIDRPVAHVYHGGNELTVVGLESLAGFDRSHPGGGMFFDARVDDLSELAGFVTRKDQTVTAHGFSRQELEAFAGMLQGRGVNRIVPFGEALTFSTFWDGYDLLAELTQTIDVFGSRSPSMPHPVSRAASAERP